MIEKRRHARNPVDLEAKVSDGTRTLEGRARDLSVGGMFFEGEAAFAFGTKVEVSLGVLTLTHGFVIPAVVRWTAPEGLGLQFGLLGARETHEITKILSRK